MNKVSRRLLLTVACSATSLGFAQGSLAQAAGIEPQADATQTGNDSGTAAPDTSTGATQNGDIIVTAQKRSERLRDVPMSITAASGEQLKTQGITGPEQFEKLAPGFTFNKTLYGQPVFFIRGVGFNDTSLGVSPAVSVYIDQLPIPFSPMSRGTTLDLERVEVLKGPQGTLFGQNSTGGAINFIAAKPTDTLHAGFDISVGRFQQVDAEAFVSGPLTDTLSARVAVRNEYRGNWQRGYTIDEALGRKDFHNGRLTIDWQPTSAIRVELSANGWQDKSDAQQQQFVKNVPLVTGPMAYVVPFPISTFPAAPDDNRAAAWDRDRSYRQDNWFYQFGGRVDADLTDTVSVTSLTSYARFGQSIPTDFDTTTFPASTNLVNGRVRSFAQELRLNGSLSGDRVKWVIGGNYQRDRVDEVIISTLSTSAIQIGPTLLSSFNIENFQRIKTEAVFGSLDVKITDTLTAQGSARYTKQKRGFTGCLRDSGNGAAANTYGFLSTILTGAPQTIAPGACATLTDAGFPAPILTDNLNEDNVSWRGSLNWKPTADALIYANVTKGFKSGSFASIPYSNALEAAPVKQESVLAYEIGAKLSAFARVLEVNGALFYYDYRDKQLNGYVNIFPFGALPALVTIPKSTVKGAELSATLRPVDGLTLSANATYVDTRIDRDPSNPIGPFGNVTSFVGQRFPITPKWQGVVDGQYRFSLNDNLAAYFGSSLTYHSATSGILLSGAPAVATNEAPLKIRAYTLIDVRAGVEIDGGKMRVEAWGRNVTDKFYVSGVARNSDYVSRYTGMPATYGMSLFYRY
ncbi:Pesticin receptor (plasmid) [Sphingobium sp. AntQ-1]|uniref:TonB-dependent receptor n=1 Tax=Sphingobium sp. AntQ-1 TaxID=2930091 RepID=UPI00234E50C9|nr:TonB-dependent receptor [Sphingobium sp. AntQ-1]WCP16246.1 Pesticin receptor [Sphingobium sp. AntQ-1]